MNDLDTFPLEQLSELVETTWVSIVGTPIHTAIDSGSPGSHDQDVVTACIHIAGAWNGVVLVQPSHAAAKRLAAAFMNIAEADLEPADVTESVAELCNIVGGGVKSLLPGPAALSLPLVMHGASHAVHVPATRQFAHVQLFADDVSLDVRVLQKV